MQQLTASEISSVSGGMPSGTQILSFVSNAHTVFQLGQMLVKEITSATSVTGNDGSTTNAMGDSY
jgi:hypothetical protein